MYRFSSGLLAQKITNGKEGEKLLAIKGSEKDNVQVSSSKWQLHKVTDEGRFWKLKDKIDFSVFKRPVDENLFFELGGRYDFLDQRVATITRGIVKEIKRYHNKVSNIGLAGGG